MCLPGSLEHGWTIQTKLLGTLERDEHACVCVVLLWDGLSLEEGKERERAVEAVVPPAGFWLSFCVDRAHSEPLEKESTREALIVLGVSKREYEASGGSVCLLGRWA